MIKVIIFDIGGVLVEIDYLRFLNNISEEFKVPLSKLMDYSPDGVHEDYMKGKITGEQFHEAICRRYHQSISLERFKQLWATILVGQNEAVARIVTRLHQRYQLAIISNIDPWHSDYCLESFPIIGTFKRKFLSYEWHLIKPDPDFFTLVANQLNVQPPECLLIDDLDENVRSAERVGFQVIQFADASKLTIELQKLGIH